MLEKEEKKYYKIRNSEDPHKKEEIMIDIKDRNRHCIK